MIKKNLYQDLSISLGAMTLKGCLFTPQGPQKAKGMVIFVHGSGSSRFSPRNQFVATYLAEKSISSLLIDLLTEEEDAIDERTREFRFNIDLLACRLLQITDWMVQNPEMGSLPLGYFGASTGSAAALIGAAKRVQIAAVVSRGGRPDLAAAQLSSVQAPTLLIVGGNDGVVIDLNRQALEALQCEKKLEIVPLATHLFEEPGCLEVVARLASDWFLLHFSTESP